MDSSSRQIIAAHKPLLVRWREPGSDPTSYLLGTSSIYIGRADDNHIVIHSEVASKYHATIVFDNGNYIVRDNQSRNGIRVNGVKVHEAVLLPGDKIEIGGEHFLFNPKESSHPSPQSPDPSKREESESFSRFQSSQPLGPSKRRSPRINRRVLIYGGVTILLLSLWLTSKKEETSHPNTGEAPLSRNIPETSVLHTTDEPKLVSPDSAPTDPILKSAEEAMKKLDWNNASLREAESYFRRGQREYLNENYNRAMGDFQTALSFYSGHVLAEKYLERTLYQIKVDARHHWTLGVQYFESLQYSRAIYHFTQVITLLESTPKDSIVDLSKRYIVQAQRRIESAELFP